MRYYKKTRRIKIKIKIKSSRSRSSQIASSFLITLQRFEERFKIPGSEARKVVPLDNLDEDCWAIEKMLWGAISVSEINRKKKGGGRERDEPW